MSYTNPLLGMSIYSLINALELYQKDDPKEQERRRFGAIILMDNSVEYILKAKIYQFDPKEFMDKQNELNFWSGIQDKRISFFEDEKRYLGKVHEARNFSQHQGIITDSLTSQQYMQWLCKFMDRFAKDNFQGLTMVYELPLQLRVTWVKLTKEKTFTPNYEAELNEPLQESYKAIKNWIKNVEVEHGGEISEDYRQQLLTHMRRYCRFLGMNPDELVEYANNGYVSPDEDLKRFEKSVSFPYSYHTIMKNFYDFHKIEITLPCPKYKPHSTVKEISTEQLRKMIEKAPLRTKSWLLANSYMGLKLAKLSLLTVDDFHMGEWDETKDFYQVQIRQEVNNNYGYTTFIGSDAKDLLEEYFKKNNFSGQDHPWSYKRRSNFNLEFQHCCQKVGFYEKGKTVPKSLRKRLKRKLKESGMLHEWIGYLFGLKVDGSNPSKPLDYELSLAYEKVYPNLRVYGKKNSVL